jgi:hypothetical protein
MDERRRSGSGTRTEVLQFVADCEHWYAAERVLPQSRFEFQDAGSQFEEAVMEDGRGGREALCPDRGLTKGITTQNGGGRTNANECDERSDQHWNERIAQNCGNRASLGQLMHNDLI